jgi:hypothetical protein
MKSACTVLLSVVCSGLQYFSTLAHKRHDFRKESHRTHNVCSDLRYKFTWNPPRFKKNWMGYNQQFISVFVQSTFCTFPTSMKLEFSRQICEQINPFNQMLNFMKIRYGGRRVVSFGRTDGRTDGEIWRSQWSLFAILRKRPNMSEIWHEDL